MAEKDTADNYISRLQEMNFKPPHVHYPTFFVKKILIFRHQNDILHAKLN